MSRADRVIRLATTGSVGLLALIAGVVSFGHMHELARDAGEGALTASLIPFSVDGMIVASSMSLLVDSRSGRRGGVLPWALLVLGSVASLAANVAAATPSVEGRVIAAWPSFALMGAYELLMRQVRNTAGGELAGTGQRGQVPVRVADRGGQKVGTGILGRPHHMGTAATKAEAIAASPPGRGSKVQCSGISRSRGRMRRDSRRLTEAADLQRRALEWAMANRSADGSLPTGRRIAEQFGRSHRWGRLIKQAAVRTLSAKSRDGKVAVRAA